MTHAAYDFGAMPDFLLIGQKTIKTACGKRVALSSINNTEPECAAQEAYFLVEDATQLWQEFYSRA